MAEANITLKKPLEHVVIEVSLKITKEFKLRLWLGKILLTAAARVTGALIEFKTPEPTPCPHDAMVKLDGVVTDVQVDNIRRRINRAYDTRTMRQELNREKHQPPWPAAGPRYWKCNCGDFHGADVLMCMTCKVAAPAREAPSVAHKLPNESSRRISEQPPELTEAATKIAPRFTAATGLPDAIHPENENRRYWPVGSESDDCDTKSQLRKWVEGEGDMKRGGPISADTTCLVGESGQDQMPEPQKEPPGGRDNCC